MRRTAPQRSRLQVIGDGYIVYRPATSGAPRLHRPDDRRRSDHVAVSVGAPVGGAGASSIIPTARFATNVLGCSGDDLATIKRAIQGKGTCCTGCLCDCCRTTSDSTFVAPMDRVQHGIVALRNTALWDASPERHLLLTQPGVEDEVAHVGDALYGPNYPDHKDTDKMKAHVERCLGALDGSFIKACSGNHEGSQEGKHLKEQYKKVHKASEIDSVAIKILAIKNHEDYCVSAMDCWTGQHKMAYAKPYWIFVDAQASRVEVFYNPNTLTYDEKQKEFLRVVAGILANAQGCLVLANSFGFTQDVADAMRRADWVFRYMHHGPETHGPRIAKAESEKYDGVVDADNEGCQNVRAERVFLDCFQVPIKTPAARVATSEKNEIGDVIDVSIYAHDHVVSTSVFAGQMNVCAGGGGGVSNHGDKECIAFMTEQLDLRDAYGFFRIYPHPDTSKESKTLVSDFYDASTCLNDSTLPQLQYRVLFNKMTKTARYQMPNTARNEMISVPLSRCMIDNVRYSVFKHEEDLLSTMVNAIHLSGDLRLIPSVLASQMEVHVEAPTQLAYMLSITEQLDGNMTGVNCLITEIKRLIENDRAIKRKTPKSHIKLRAALHVLLVLRHKINELSKSDLNVFSGSHVDVETRRTPEEFFTEASSWLREVVLKKLKVKTKKTVFARAAIALGLDEKTVAETEADSSDDDGSDHEAEREDSQRAKRKGLVKGAALAHEASQRDLLGEKGPDEAVSTATRAGRVGTMARSSARRNGVLAANVHEKPRRSLQMTRSSDGSESVADRSRKDTPTAEIAPRVGKLCAALWSRDSDAKDAFYRLLSAPGDEDNASNAMALVLLYLLTVTKEHAHLALLREAITTDSDVMNASLRANAQRASVGVAADWERLLAVPPVLGGIFNVASIRRLVVHTEPMLVRATVSNAFHVWRETLLQAAYEYGPCALNWRNWKPFSWVVHQAIASDGLSDVVAGVNADTIRPHFVKQIENTAGLCSSIVFCRLGGTDIDYIKPKAAYLGHPLVSKVCLFANALPVGNGDEDELKRELVALKPLPTGRVPTLNPLRANLLAHASGAAGAPAGGHDRVRTVSDAGPRSDKAKP